MKRTTIHRDKPEVTYASPIERPARDRHLFCDGAVQWLIELALNTIIVAVLVAGCFFLLHRLFPNHF